MLGDKAEARFPRALTGLDPVVPAGRETFSPLARDWGALRLPAGTSALERDFTLLEPGLNRTHWHPRCAAFAAYVEGLAAPGRLPTRGSFEPTAIHRALPNTWIIEVRRDPLRPDPLRPDPLRFVIRLAGTKIGEALGRDVTGLAFDQAFPGIDPARDLKRFTATIAARRGTWRRGPPFFDLGQSWADMEDVVMPFSADGINVDMLYCCAMFYGYDRQEW